MSKPTLKVTSDFTKEFNELIKRFKGDAVLVGIPESQGHRKEEDEISNAAILAMNHFGSPANNIPPRPVMSIGIKNAQAAIADQFKLAAKLSLTKGLSALNTYYERAGIIASNAVKAVINSQEGIKPPASSTLSARKYLTENGFKGVKALLVTGQLRNAITYVVKPWGK